MGGVTGGPCESGVDVGILTPYFAAATKGRLPRQAKKPFERRRADFDAGRGLGIIGMSGH